MIVLMRHGPVGRDLARFVVGAGAVRDWVAGYDAAPLDAQPPDLTHLSTTCIAASPLRRAQESAMGAFGRVDVTDALFAEAPLPMPRFWAASPAKWAVALLRIRWMAGRARGCDGVLATRQRAEMAAARLIALEREAGSVTLVAHGFINRLIAKALIENGYRGPATPTSQHFGRSSYEKP